MMSHIERTVILHNFSLSNKASFFQINNTTFQFYANGNCEDNKGYVSIIFHKIFRVECRQDDNLEETEARYFFSVVDVSRNKRFTQSIVDIIGKTSNFDSIGNFNLGLERYLKRETLLNDTAELLPNDCLTIFVEIDYIQCFPVPDFPVELHPSVHPDNFLEVANSKRSIISACMIEFSFSVDEHGRLCIPLDTFYGRELCYLSGFFRRASDTPLIVSTARMVTVPDEEMVAFSNIFKILFKPTMDLDVESIKDIFHLYVIAVKYDFQSVIEVCRQLIKAFLIAAEDSRVRTHAKKSVPNIIEMTNQYRDRDLKKSMRTYLRSKNSFESNFSGLRKYLEKEFNINWKCASRKRGPFRYYFRLSRIAKPELEFYL